MTVHLPCTSAPVSPVKDPCLVSPIISQIYLAPILFIGKSYHNTDSLAKNLSRLMAHLFNKTTHMN
jgi:hypothetical protein